LSIADYLIIWRNGTASYLHLNSIAESKCSSIGKLGSTIPFSSKCIRWSIFNKYLKSCLKWDNFVSVNNLT